MDYLDETDDANLSINIEIDKYNRLKIKSDESIKKIIELIKKDLLECFKIQTEMTDTYTDDIKKDEHIDMCKRIIRNQDGRLFGLLDKDLRTQLNKIPIPIKKDDYIVSQEFKDNEINFKNQLFKMYKYKSYYSSVDFKADLIKYNEESEIKITEYIDLTWEITQIYITKKYEEKYKKFVASHLFKFDSSRLFFENIKHFTSFDVYIKLLNFDDLYPDEPKSQYNKKDTYLSEIKIIIESIQQKALIYEKLKHKSLEKENAELKIRLNDMEEKLKLLSSSKFM
jgi:hypothetical protein